MFGLLAGRYPDAVSAGEIAAALDIKSSTLSVYLTRLRRAGPAAQFRDGRSPRYRAGIDEALTRCGLSRIHPVTRTRTAGPRDPDYRAGAS